ncbi:hypothetical protein [Plantactinospora sp. GCM10030261]|uniref:hypothetical protein n=1 Tax=Plantactinospora sp. GCM10030261 TaxID=3273420 RepID=UPI0036127EBF
MSRESHQHAQRRAADHDPARRRLLRRAATAAAATAGAGAAAVAMPGTAQAAPGDDMLAGRDNDAGTVATRLMSNSSATGPTLVLENSAGVPLRLVPSPNLYPGVFDRPVGTIAVDTDGDLFVKAGVVGEETNGWVWTSDWATTSVAVPPTRVLDTRDAALRSNIVSGRENLDSNGRIKAGGTIVVSLDSYVEDGYAMKANVTVTGTVSSGFLTVWGSGSRPTASTLNWSAAGQILSNFVFTPLGALAGYGSVVAINAAAPTQVVLDLTGLVVAHPGQVRVGGAAQRLNLPTVPNGRGDVAAPELEG